MSSMVKYVTEDFATEERAQEVSSFFASNVYAGTERTVQQSVETIRLNSNWLSRDINDVKQFITNAIAQ